MKGKTKLIILFAIVAVWITHIKAGESADSLTPEKAALPFLFPIQVQLRHLAPPPCRMEIPLWIPASQKNAQPS